MDGGYIHYRSIDLLSKALPRPLAYWFAVRIADRIFYNDRKGREAVTNNLRKVLEYNGLRPSRRRLNVMARQTFQNFSKYVIDFFRYGKFNSQKVDRLVSIEHPEAIEQSLDYGRGVIVVSAHYGSWEIGAGVLAGMGYPLNAVVLREKNQKTNRLFESRRGRRGIQSIGLGSAAMGVIRALRKKQFVAILADRDYSRNNRQTPFFGVPASLPAGPAIICMKTGAPLLPAFLVRQEDDNYLLRFKKPVTLDSNPTVDSIQSSICRILEEEISKNPTQWYMFREFWNYSGNGK